MSDPDTNLGHAVSLIASLLDALSSTYPEPQTLARLKAEAEAFRREHWESRNRYWAQR